MEDGRGQPGIHSRVVAEQLQKVLPFAGTAGGNDGYGAAGGHGIEQLQIKAVLDAVRVNGVYDQFPRAVFYALFEPVKGIHAGVLAPALGEQHESAVHPLDVSGKHNTLVAVFLGRSRDQARIADGAGVHADLVGTAFQHPVKIVQRVDAAADGQRNEDLACDLTQNIGEESAPLNTGRNIVKNKLVCTGSVVVPRHLDRVGHILQPGKVDTLDNTPVFYIQTRNNAFGNHAFTPPRTAAQPWPDRWPRCR